MLINGPCEGNDRVAYGPREATAGRLARLTALLLAMGLFCRAPEARADSGGTFSTTTGVPPGGSLKIDVSASGYTIAQSQSLDGCSTPGVGTAIVVYACDPVGPGIPVATSIGQTFAGGSGPILGSVTYNASGPSPAAAEPGQSLGSVANCSAAPATA
jgi:hypothetical protein